MKYTTRLTTRDGLVRMGDVVELTEEELQQRARVLSDTLANVKAVRYETRPGTILIVPTDNVAHIEILEAGS